MASKNFNLTCLDYLKKSLQINEHHSIKDGLKNVRFSSFEQKTSLEFFRIFQQSLALGQPRTSYQINHSIQYSKNLELSVFSDELSNTYRLYHTYLLGMLDKLGHEKRNLIQNNLTLFRKNRDIVPLTEEEKKGIQEYSLHFNKIFNRQLEIENILYKQFGKTEHINFFIQQILLFLTHNDV